MRKKLLLMAIFFLGSFLRLNNISPFKVYPDSYQSLLVAKNILDYHSVVGYLGPNGMLFPDFFSWTRPGYALLINFFTLFTNNMTFASQLIAFLLGIVAIPLAFFFIKNVFNKTSYALAGTLLLALSYYHTVWGGFIMTETTGVFFMILFLWSFFASLAKKTYIGNPQDILTGVLFSFAVITRYEYLMITLPVILVTLLTNKTAGYKLLNILGVSLFGISIVALLLFPLQSSLSIIQSQLSDLIKIAGVLTIFIFLLLLITKFVPDHIRQIVKHTLYKLLLLFIFIIATLLIVQIVFGPEVVLWKDFYFFRSFVVSDFLISIFAFIGLTLMLRTPALQTLSLFTLFSLVSLGYIYYKINPEMDRYMTHLLPFLLIPASYGIIKVSRIKILPVILLLFLLLQAIITYDGMHTSQDPSWFRTSYEEKSAKIVKQYVPQHQQNLLLISLPESYYYSVQTSTYSITDTYPYIYIDNAFNNRTVLLVSDMPMHIIFPTFSKFIDNNLQSYKIKEFWIQEKYHYINNIYDEKYPVVLYKMTLGELKNKIEKAHL